MQRNLLFAGRVGLGLLFVVAAATKVADPAQFAEEVANYQLLPARLVPLVAAALPGIELLAGACLLLGLYTRAAAALVSGLLAIFMVGLSQALLRGIDLRCGCFGGADEATWGTVGRDALMLATGLLVLWRGAGRFAADDRSPAR